jgi:hypothetical protein
LREQASSWLRRGALARTTVVTIAGHGRPALCDGGHISTPPWLPPARLTEGAIAMPGKYPVHHPAVNAETNRVWAGSGSGKCSVAIQPDRAARVCREGARSGDSAWVAPSTAGKAAR